MRMIGAVGLAAMALGTPVLGQQPRSTARAWAELASADVAAALQLIESNHPGAAAELGDTHFQQLLRTARANTERRLPLVSDYFAYVAVMNGLANDFRDGHIWSNGIVSPSRRTWAGLVMGRRGGKWVVAAEESANPVPSLKGAELVDCDGVPAEQFARERTGTFHAHPDVEADLAGRAYTLLLDEQSPYVRRPVSCQFRLAGGPVARVDLQWREIGARKLEALIAESQHRASAGMGVSAFAGGQWIALESLDNRADAVVDQVRARQAELRAAAMVVVDLRGNSGGNSQYALDIARLLVGDARANAAERMPSGCDGAYWRVSPDNATALAKFADSLPPERAPEWRAQATAMRSALTAGQSFSPMLPACATRVRPALPTPAKFPRSMMQGRLVLLTDRACFSSCLMAANLLRNLGALHVGEATDMSTRYMEVREIILPSGLRTFSTLQKVALGTGDFGPYAPSLVYPGPLDETDTLKAWVAALPR